MTNGFQSSELYQEVLNQVQILSTHIQKKKSQIAWKNWHLYEIGIYTNIESKLFLTKIFANFYIIFVA